jgi:putative endonuclease
VAGTLSRRFRLRRGQAAERRAERFLRRQGLRFVARNYRTRVGELDLVMLESDCVVVIEVRYRRDSRFVEPALTVDEIKQARIIRATRTLLSEHAWLADYAIRFDVIAIEDTQARPGTIQWIRDAFRV